MTFGDYIDRECREARREERREANVGYILDLLADLGDVPEELIMKINAQQDNESLRKLHKLAARADSIEDFEEQMEEVINNTMVSV